MGRHVGHSGREETVLGSAAIRPADIDWDAPEVAARLRDAGVRPTVARRRVVALLQALRVHPTVDELQQLLSRHDRDVHQATLYQTVAKLAEAGVIASFIDNDGLLRLDAEVESHPHLICTRCGKIADIEPSESGSTQLAELSLELSRDHPEWRVAETRVEFRALCPVCARVV